MTEPVKIPQHVILGMQRLAAMDGDVVAYYTSEADLRNALAAAWWLRGYKVETERRIVGVGRIDLMISDHERQALIEIKKDLPSIALARQAVRQADTYRRFVDPQPDATYVAFASKRNLTLDEELAIERAYQCNIRIWSIAWLVSGTPLASWPLRETAVVKRDAKTRRDALAAMTAVSRAISDLDSRHRESQLLKELMVA